MTGHAATGDTMAGLAELLRGGDPALADLPRAAAALALGDDAIGALRALADARPGWRGCGLVAPHRPSPRGGDPAVRGDVAALPFPAGAFDAVLADHLPDRLSGAGRVAQELARVCRPSGRIVVVLDGRDHQAELLRVVGEVAGIGSSAPTSRFTFEDAVEGGLAPAIEIVTSQLRRDELVATGTAALMSAVQRLRPRIEPRLRGFVNWTTVLARSREAFEHALAEQPEWRIAQATGFVVGRPRSG